MANLLSACVVIMEWVKGSTNNQLMHHDLGEARVMLTIYRTNVQTPTILYLYYSLSAKWYIFRATAIELLTEQIQLLRLLITIVSLLFSHVAHKIFIFSNLVYL